MSEKEQQKIREGASAESAEVSENRLISERRAKLDSLREQGNAFPNTFRRADWADDLQNEYGESEKDALAERAVSASVAGRLMAKRGPFFVLQDMTGRIQLYADKTVQKQIKHWDLGDIVGVSGELHKSGKGDLYVMMEEFHLLTKSLRPLPEKFHGLADQETRYRQRYLDLIVSEDTRKTFQIRSQIIESLRDFLKQKRFVEVETPMLQVTPGGATARPFVTHHNALDIDMYLRIAPELYLKRLVVGGIERVFEINRNFRNEGLSTRHNPEFTMIEFYQAYADYHELMDLTESLFRHLADSILGQSTLTYQGETFDLARPFDRMTVLEAILAFNEDVSIDTLSDRDSAGALAESLEISVKPEWGLGKIQIEIFEKTAEHRLMHPTFITEYPTEVSPLARRSDTNAHVTDRFEFFVGGREIANGFSELNDPEDQAERFRKQMEEKEAGDLEAMSFDEDYIRALEHGLPPTAGEGIGIDRLVMLFADAPSIRDVILFPHMRPQDNTET